MDDNLEEFPSEDPTSMLEQLDAGFEDFAPPDEQPPSPPPLSQQEIEDVVDRVLTEELARLDGAAPKKKKD